MTDKVNIEDRIVKYMEIIYGEKVNLLKNDLDDYGFNTEDLNRIKYYVGDLYNKNIIIYKSDLTNLKGTISGKLQIFNYENLLNANISNKISNDYSWSLLNIFSVLPEIYKPKQFLYNKAECSRKAS